MAAQDLDALLAEVPDDETPETPEVAGTESEQAAEAAAALKLAELDAVIPSDAADVDEAFRGKPLAEVLRIAAQHQHEIGVARSKSQQFNALESRARVAEGALEWLQQQIAERGQPQQGPSQAPETDQDLLDRLAQQPGAVLSEKITEEVDPLRNQIQELVNRNVRLSADFAREQARNALGIDPDTWEAITPQLAAVTASRLWNIEDPRAWYAAGQEYVSNLQRFMPPPAAPPVDVPRPAAPPSGGARSTSRPSAPVKLRGRDEENANDIMSAFGITPDSARAADFKTFIATRSKGVES